MNTDALIPDEATLRRVVADEVRRALATVIEAIGDDSGAQGRTDASVFMTGHELAELLRVDRRTLRRMVLAGEIPAPLTLGERTQRWRRTTIEKWVRKSEQRA